MSLSDLPPVVVKPLALAPRRVRLGFWQTLAVIVGPLLLCDFLLLPLTVVIKAQHALAVLVYGCFGLIVAQGVLLCVAHVLGTGRLIARSAIAWGWGWLGVMAWVAGLLVAFSWERWPGPNFRDIATILSSIPLFALAVQTPLWIGRFVFGWRLSHRDHQEPAPTSIADFFVVTTLVAATFAIANFGQFLSGARSSAFWPIAGMAWGISSGVSLLVLLPLLWLLLHRQASKAAVLFSLAAVGVATFIFCVIDSGLNPARLRWSWRVTGVSVTLLAIVLGTHAGLAFLHRHGWRLAIGRKQIEKLSP
jgi:hypothetical protein